MNTPHDRDLQRQLCLARISAAQLNTPGQIDLHGNPSTDLLIVEVGELSSIAPYGPFTVEDAVQEWSSPVREVRDTDLADVFAAWWGDTDGLDGDDASFSLFLDVVSTRMVHVPTPARRNAATLSTHRACAMARTAGIETIGRIGFRQVSVRTGRLITRSPLYTGTDSSGPAPVNAVYVPVVRMDAPAHPTTER